MKDCPTEYAQLFVIKHNKKEFDERYNELKNCKTPFDFDFIITENGNKLTFSLVDWSSKDAPKVALKVESEKSLEEIKILTSGITRRDRYAEKWDLEADLNNTSLIDYCNLSGREEDGDITIGRTLEVAKCFAEKSRNIEWHNDFIASEIVLRIGEQRYVESIFEKDGEEIERRVLRELEGEEFI